MKISIIGSGFVGKKVGMGLETVDNPVIFYDINKEVVNSLKKHHEASLDLEYTINHSSISFICVPTPYNDGFDSGPIESVLNEIGEILKEKEGYHLVVIKSTVPPTTTRKVLIPILNKYRKVGEDLGVCMNPEFMTQNSASWTDDLGFKKDFLNEDRIILGEYDKKSGDILEKLYKPLKSPRFRTDLDTAEMIKYASNCMLATKISYWNQIFLICKELDIDSNEVAHISSLDPRIGKYGTVHGKAFAGACLKKDLKSFIEFAGKHADLELLKSVDDINEKMKKIYGERM